MEQHSNRLFLVWRIISTTLQEGALVAVVLWGLPALGVELPPWVIAPVGLAILVADVITYRKSVRALRAAPAPGLATMLGTEGEAVEYLAPTGQVRIGGELWQARAASGRIAPGSRVVVVGQKRLRLIVRPAQKAPPPGTPV